MPTHVPEEMADFDLEQLASSSYTIYLVCYAIGYYLHAAPLSRNRTPYVYGTNNYKMPLSGQPGSLSAHLFSLGPAPEIQHRTRGGRVSPEPHRGGFTSPRSAAGGVRPISTPARSLPGTGPHLVGGSQVLELLLGPGVVGVPVGVQLQRQLAVRLLDVLHRGAAGHPQDLVEIPPAAGRHGGGGGAPSAPEGSLRRAEGGAEGGGRGKPGEG